LLACQNISQGEPVNRKPLLVSANNCQQEQLKTGRLPLHVQYLYYLIVDGLWKAAYY